MRFTNKKRRAANIVHPDLNFIKDKFNECNQKYFNNELESIPIEIMESEENYGEFYCTINDKNNSIENMMIKIDTSHDRTELEYISTLIHEMIHYKIMSKLEKSRIKRAVWYSKNNKKEIFNELLYQDKYAHSSEFVDIANNINKIYNLKIHLK